MAKSKSPMKNDKKSGAAAGRKLAKDPAADYSMKKSSAAGGRKLGKC